MLLHVGLHAYVSEGHQYDIQHLTDRWQSEISSNIWGKFVLDSWASPQSQSDKHVGSFSPTTIKKSTNWAQEDFIL